MAEAPEPGRGDSPETPVVVAPAPAPGLIRGLASDYKAVASLVGLLVYGVVRVSYDAYYSRLGVFPEAVGLTETTILGRAVLYLALTASVAAILGGLWFGAVRLGVAALQRSIAVAARGGDPGPGARSGRARRGLGQGTRAPRRAALCLLLLPALQVPAARREHARHAERHSQRGTRPSIPLARHRSGPAWLVALPLSFSAWPPRSCRSSIAAALTCARRSAIGCVCRACSRVA